MVQYLLKSIVEVTQVNYGYNVTYKQPGTTTIAEWYNNFMDSFFDFFLVMMNIILVLFVGALIILIIAGIVYGITGLIAKVKTRHIKEEDVWAKVTSKEEVSGVRVPQRIGNVTTFRKTSDTYQISLAYGECEDVINISKEMYDWLEEGDTIRCTLTTMLDKDQNPLNRRITPSVHGYAVKRGEEINIVTTL